MRVEIDGVPYMPVAEVPGAADLCRMLAEQFWGKGAREAGDPAEWEQITVLVTDDTRYGGRRRLTIPQFVQRLLE